MLEATGLRRLISIGLIFSALSLMSSLPATARDRYTVRFQVSEDIIIQWQQGIQIAYSKNPQFEVLLQAINFELPDDQSTFRVLISNTGENPINFGPDNVWFEVPNSQRVVMQTFEELAGRHRRDLDRRRTLAAIGGALSGASSSNGERTGSTSFHGTTSNGTTFNGSGTYTYYDQELAMKQRQQAESQNQALQNALNTRQLSGEEALDSLLRDNTVAPGQIYGGTFAYDPDRSLRNLDEDEAAVIVVRIGEFEQRFEVTLSEL